MHVSYTVSNIYNKMFADFYRIFVLNNWFYLKYASFCRETEKKFLENFEPFVDIHLFQCLCKFTRTKRNSLWQPVQLLQFLEVSVPLLAAGGRSSAAAAALGQERMDASERSHMTKLRRVWKAGEFVFFFFFGQRETVDRTDSASLRATRCPTGLAEKEVQASLYFCVFLRAPTRAAPPLAGAPSLKDNFRDVITEHHRKPALK